MIEVTLRVAMRRRVPKIWKCVMAIISFFYHNLAFIIFLLVRNSSNIREHFHVEIFPLVPFPWWFYVRKCSFRRIHQRQTCCEMAKSSLRTFNFLAMILIPFKSLSALYPVDDLLDEVILTYCYLEILYNGNTDFLKTPVRGLRKSEIKYKF